MLYRKLKNTLAPPPVPAESSETLDQIGVAEFFFDPKKIRTAPPSTNARTLTAVVVEDPSLIEMGAGISKVVFFLDHYSPTCGRNSFLFLLKQKILSKNGSPCDNLSARTS